MIKIIIFLILTIFIYIPSNVNAIECNNDIKQKMYNIANQIDIKYVLIDEQNLSENDKLLNNRFKFVITNIPKDIVIEDNSIHMQYSNQTNDKSMFESPSILEGMSYQFYYFYTGNECDTYLIKTKTVNVPYYNEFWDSKICEGLEDYVYCKKYTTIKINYEYLEKQVNTYKQKNNNNNKVTEEKSNSFFRDNFILCLIPIFIIVPIIILFIKKRKKRRKIL